MKFRGRHRENPLLAPKGGLEAAAKTLGELLLEGNAHCSNDVQHDRAFPGTIEFRQENRLPAPKGELAVFDRDDDRLSQEAGLYMGLKVSTVITESGVHRDQLAHLVKYVARQVGVLAPTDHQTRCGMGQEEKANPFLCVALLNGLVYLVSDVFQPLLRASDDTDVLVHRSIPIRGELTPYD